MGDSGNCDGDGVTGVGDDGWYRFAGDGGNALALQPPGNRHCGTYGAGWLSDWSPDAGKPPMDYSEAGTLPGAADGVVEMVACFDGSNAPDTSYTCSSRETVGVVWCDGFWLFRLPYAPGCGQQAGGYCTGDSPLPTARPIPSPPQLGPPEGFDESYTVSGCANPSHCGVFRRTNAHCTDTVNGRCPGGDWFREGANGNTDAKLCDGVPVFQRVGQGGGVDGSGPVLYRFYDVDSGETVWRVGPSARLADCYYASTDYLHSNHGATAGAPTAPGYSARKGWYDHETNGARGTISVAASASGGDSGACGTNTCEYHGDSECDDGSQGGTAYCDLGTDCDDCGNCCGAGECGTDTCEYHGDSECDDGSQGGTAYCDLGTDCGDCGNCCGAG